MILLRYPGLADPRAKMAGFNNAAPSIDRLLQQWDAGKSTADMAYAASAQEHEIDRLLWRALQARRLTMPIR